MTRDYKNITVHRAKSKKSNVRGGVRQGKSKQSLPAWFLLVTGVIFGVFVSFLLYLNSSVDVQRGGEVVSNEIIQKSKPIETKKVEETSKKEFPFGFYDILPNRTIEIPQESVEPLEIKPKIAEREKALPQKKIELIETANLTHTTNEVVIGKKPIRSLRYVLQVGSFSHFRDADKRKANLAFMGVVSKIHAISNSANRTTYRVRVGPYANIKKINEITSLLKQNNIPSLLMRVNS